MGQHPPIRNSKNNRHGLWRRLLLDIRVFVNLFPWRMASAFFIVLFIMTFIFYQAYVKNYPADAEAFSYIKALFAIINMATFQVSYADIPPGPTLDLYFVIVPLISIPLLLMFGLNLIQVVRVFFVRQERGQMWQQVLAKTTPNPIVICGLGRVGYRIASELHAEGYPVIGVEAKCSPLVDKLIDADMPVIIGDIRNADVLYNASVPKARQVLVCTHDDLTNIMAVNHIRKMNPDTGIILRLFDDDIGEEIKDTFQISNIISRSAVAAQAFAYAAIGLEVLETFHLADKIYVLVEIPFKKTGCGRMTLADYTRDIEMTVVCLYHNGVFIVEPAATTVLLEQDTVIVFTELANLAYLQLHPDKRLSHIIVCGIGHTGFRIVKSLIAMGQEVCAFDFEPNDLTQRLAEQGVDVKYGDYRKNPSLLSAKIREASALITAAEDDMVNVETIVRAVDLAPSIRIIARLFEESLSHRLQQAFNINAIYSTSEIAAPAFIAAVMNIHLTQPVNLGNDDLLIVRLSIHQQSLMNESTIYNLNQLADTTVLLYRKQNNIVVPPPQDTVLQPGDEIVVLTSRQELDQLNL